ncbi:tRNA preQ1(34) S-adenosylmethionine ribosyltransferase-isomerase QueA [Methylophilaceae bacterium]|nr:tRNA preQ1(34) S-adenosylmethionine ribosyltransferase-isomerase QueA [Methylophilaceae bacterium]
MRIDDFDYELPKDLIAQFPPKKRGQSKLLIVNPLLKKIYDSKFVNLFDLINPNDLVVFNDTKVLKARLFGMKETGGKIEILIERIIDNKNALAMIRSSKKISEKNIIHLSDEYNLIIYGRENNLYKIKLNKGSFYTVLENFGHIPLPPYINREDNLIDEDRYQTIYAKESGAVAAPTAGLHFSKKDIDNLKIKNINFTFITLHVGSGTFQPVKTDDLNHHVMHKEAFSIDEKTRNLIEMTKNNGGRVIAIGTTVLRALESAFNNNNICIGNQETKIFIKPGYKFNVVDALFTNFHLPKSTLLMLVSAFLGHEFTKEIYQHAILKRYRFFSYGDAMFIEQKIE